ncbi:hypothetical protein J1N35_043714 [Gossypium stocksii]|uniref:Uncharacterized protein n=1 Tax=Gossypium stocksii TaxID=47602 RepID=A0A9D3U829_9ROSI|nr:hypothetical protein J1N35_043714 [Gossypium stocksii]
MELHNRQWYAQTFSEPPCDPYEMPSCEITNSSNSKLLSNMSEISQIFLRAFSSFVPPREEVVHDVPNFDLEDPRIIIDHPELDNNSQQEFETGDHGDELNMAEAAFDPIEVVVDMDLIVVTNTELKLIFSEIVKNAIHFLAIVGEMPTKEAEEFVSFSFDDRGNVRAIEISRNMEMRNLEAIIPRKIIWG